MGNGSSIPVCCQTPIVKTILDQPTFFTAQSQYKLFLRQNLHINEALLPHREMQSQIMSLIERHQPREQPDGIYIGELSQSRESMRAEKNSNLQSGILKVAKQGSGLFMYKQKDFYFGTWRKNERSGEGILVFSNGDVYRGNFYQNEPHGAGVYEGRNPQRKYEGRWEKGLQSGTGTEYYSDGSFYTGDYKAGMKEGKGKVVYKDGTFYEGQFKNDRIEGEGLFSGKKHRYEGDWQDGKMHGTGKSEWFNERGEVISSYIGQYEHGIKSGFGQYRWGKGRTYKGKWQNGEIKNAGVLMDIESPNKLSRISGY